MRYTKQVENTILIHNLRKCIMLGVLVKVLWTQLRIPAP